MGKLQRQLLHLFLLLIPILCYNYYDSPFLLLAYLDSSQNRQLNIIPSQPLSSTSLLVLTSLVLLYLFCPRCQKGPSANCRCQLRTLSVALPLGELAIPAMLCVSDHV